MAVRFDATTDRMRFTTGSPLVSAFTAMGWFKISVDTDNYATFILVGNDTGASPYPYVSMITDSNGVRLTLWTGGSLVPGTTLTVGTWYHLCMTANGTALTIYLNGVSDITGTATGTVASGEIEVGNSAQNERLNGCVTAIKVWDAALTAVEIQQEMQVIRPVRFANLNTWSPCFPGVTERLRDYSGNGHTWTETGTLADEDGPPISWGAEVIYLNKAGVVAPGVTIPRFMHHYRQLRAA